MELSVEAIEERLQPFTKKINMFFRKVYDNDHSHFFLISTFESILSDSSPHYGPTASRKERVRD